VRFKHGDRLGSVVLHQFQGQFHHFLFFEFLLSRLFYVIIMSISLIFLCFTLVTRNFFSLVVCSAQVRRMPQRFCFFSVRASPRSPTVLKLQKKIVKIFQPPCSLAIFVS